MENKDIIYWWLHDIGIGDIEWYWQSTFPKESHKQKCIIKYMYDTDKFELVKGDLSKENIPHLKNNGFIYKKKLLYFLNNYIRMKKLNRIL